MSNYELFGATGTLDYEDGEKLNLGKLRVGETAAISIPNSDSEENKHPDLSRKSSGYFSSISQNADRNDDEFESFSSSIDDLRVGSFTNITEDSNDSLSLCDTFVLDRSPNEPSSIIIHANASEGSFSKGLSLRQRDSNMSAAVASIHLGDDNFDMSDVMTNTSYPADTCDIQNLIDNHAVDHGNCNYNGADGATAAASGSYLEDGLTTVMCTDTPMAQGLDKTDKECLRQQFPYMSDEKINILLGIKVSAGFDALIEYMLENGIPAEEVESYIVQTITADEIISEQLTAEFSGTYNNYIHECRA
jgi:hypothetical protein